ncbi:MAG: translocation/assembly module TamB domain-containing protein [Alphaproteobacteria bacterium]|nr:translocation/assembly module TamB domain-containing protein [Alphaproteobacteria bacterium]
MRRTMKVSGFALVGLVVLLVVAVLSLQTRFVAGHIERIAANSVPGLEVSGLTFSLTGRVTLDRIAMADEDGVWMTADDIRLDWRWRPLVNRTLTIDEASVGSLDIDRPPLDRPATDAGPDPAPEGEKSAIAFPRIDLPVAIDLRRFGTDRLWLGPAVAGQETLLKMSGAAEANRQGRLDLTLDIRRENGVGGALKAGVLVDPRDQTLDLVLEGAEPRGGIIAGLLGVPGAPPTTVTLAGDGTLDAWSGTVSATIGTDIATDLDLSLAFRPSLEVTVKGNVMPGPLVPADATGYVGETVALDLAAALSSDSAIDVQRLKVSLAAGRVEAQGALSADGTVAGHLEFRTGPGLVLPAPYGVAAASLTAAVDGPMGSPSITVVATVTDPKIQDAGIDPLLAGTSRLEAVMNPSLAAGTVDIEDLRFASDLIEMTGDGAANWRQPGGMAVLSVAAPDLQPFSDVAGLALQGRMDGLIVLDVAENAHTTAEITVENLKTGLGEVDALLPPRLSLSLSGAAPTHGGPVRIEDLAVDAGPILLNAAGILDPVGDTTGVIIHIDLPDLAAFDPLAGGIGLAGQGGITGEIDGPLDDPSISGRVSAQRLSIADNDFETLSVALAAERILSRPRADVDLAVGTRYGPVALTGSVTLDKRSLSVSDLTLRQDRINAVSGTLAIDLDTFVASGRLALDVPALASLSDLAGQDIDGRLRATIDLSERAARQSARLRLKAEGLEASGVVVRNTVLDLTASGFTASDPMTAALDLKGDIQGIEVDGARIDRLDVSANGPLSALAVELAGNGSTGEPFDIEMAALIGAIDGITGRVDRLAARFGAATASLDTPARFSLGPDGMTVDVPGLTVLEAVVTADMSLADTVEGTLTLDGLDLQRVTGLYPDAPPLRGSVSSTLTLSGAATDPTLSLRTAINEAGVDTEGAPLPTLTGDIEVNTSAGRTVVEAWVSGFADEPLTVQADVPVSVDLAAFAPRIDTGAPFAGEIAWRGDVAQLMRYVPVAGISAGGLTDIDIRAAGTFEKPEVSGVLALSDGTVSSTLAGVTLTPVTALISGETDRITLDVAAATPRDGTLGLRGYIDLAAPLDPTVALTLTAENATLAKREDVTAAIDAAIAIGGQASDMSVTGEIKPREIAIRLIDALPPSVTTIDVVRREDLETAVAEEETAPPSRVALDLNIPINGRVFVRGRGLDSEWGGGFRVTGTADAPVLSGQIMPIRGQLNFAGRGFDITESVIRFDGKTDRPTLAIRATTQAEDVTAIVSVAGTPADPEIVFSSEPELPRDEVMARILFGKSTAQLTQAEALQLAQAVATATSGEAGFTDMARDALGLDQLGFGGAGDGGLGTIEAGRNVAEGVYVGIEQGASAASTRVKVEVDVTDRIKVETEVGGTAESRVGVTYEFDY